MFRGRQPGEDSSVERLLACLQVERQARFPHALLMGPQFCALVAEQHAGGRNPFDADFTPASAVTHNMLNQNDEFDYDAEIRFLYAVETGSRDAVHGTDAVQGYIDAVALYLSACYGAVNRVDTVFMDEVLNTIPQFERLPSEVHHRITQSILDYGAWAGRTLQRRDIVDGRGFMDLLVHLMAAEGRSAPYQFGMRTARDTLLAHVALIEACVDGTLLGHR